MATRSIIGKINSDGSVTAVYCHWDGYKEEVGNKLLEFYNSTEKVDQLLTLGSLSSLGSTLQDTVAYHRDRGEDWDTCKPKTYPSRDGMLRNEYVYLWDGTQWLWSSLSLDPYSLSPRYVDWAPLR